MNLAAIAQSLNVLFEDEIASQINRATVALQVYQVRTLRSSAIKWNARFGTGKGKVIADGADVPAGDYDQDDKVPANLDFGTYHEPFQVTGKALAGALATDNPAQLTDLFGEEGIEAIERLAKKISEDIYIGSGAVDTMHGLIGSPGALSATGTYAGIDRATYPQWGGNVLSNGGVGRALTLALMRSARTAGYKASGFKPDVILTTPEILEKYASLIDPQRRYVQEVTLRGQKIVLDGGHQALEFDGLPMFEDVDCPDGKMVLSRSSNISIVQMPDPNTQVNEGMGDGMGIKGTFEEQLGMPRERLRARINPLGRTGDNFKFQLICYPQLQVRSPFQHVVIEDIDPTL